MELYLLTYVSLVFYFLTRLAEIINLINYKNEENIIILSVLMY